MAAMGLHYPMLQSPQPTPFELLRTIKHGKLACDAFLSGAREQKVYTDAEQRALNSYEAAVSQKGLDAGVGTV